MNRKKKEEYWRWLNEVIIGKLKNITKIKDIWHVYISNNNIFVI